MTDWEGEGSGISSEYVSRGRCWDRLEMKEESTFISCMQHIDCFELYKHYESECDMDRDPWFEWRLFFFKS